MPDEASAFTVLLRWDVAFSHEFSSQQGRQGFSVYFVHLESGFSYGFCSGWIGEFHLDAFVLQLVVDLDPVVG